VIIEEASEVDVEMIQQMMTKIDYAALKHAYQQIYEVTLDAVKAADHQAHILQYLPHTLPDEIPNELLPTTSTTSQQQQQTDILDDEAVETNDIRDNNIDGTTNNNNDDDAPDDTNIDSTKKQLLYKTLFLALFEIHIIEGTLICPDTQREFPIKDGIPNMILHEDEL
jgi:uncharacterized protein YbaR (Trm112 family)